MGKVGTIAVWTLGAVVVATVAAMVWQHQRYVDARRNALHDAQDVLHSSDALHAATFLRVPPARDLFEAMRTLRAATDAFPGAQTVYAGKTALNALSSTQLTEAFGGEVAWDAVTLVQFDDRSTYDAYRDDPGVQAALAGFANDLRTRHEARRPREPATPAGAARVENRTGRHVPAFRPAFHAGERGSRGSDPARAAARRT